MKQFETLAFRDGESIGNFAIHINRLITSLCEFDEEMEMEDFYAIITIYQYSGVAF